MRWRPIRRGRPPGPPAPEISRLSLRDALPISHLLTQPCSANDPGYATGRREVRLSDVEGYEEMNAHERRLLYNFNDVAAAYRREVWEKHPFPRTPFGEDVLMAQIGRAHV